MPSRIVGSSWPATWKIAPAPTPKRKAALAGESAAAPIQAPDDRRRARDQPERDAGGGARGASPASGATIARPSVVLWSAKPMTRKAPRASAPTA